MRKNSGGAAEEAAVLFLEGKGIRILERNFRSYHGEIDIIALEQEMILVVEVKMRSYGDCGTAAEAVDFRKQKRIWTDFRKKEYSFRMRSRTIIYMN